MLRDLNQIILRKTIVGIVCPDCSGHLEEIVIADPKPPKWWKRWMMSARGAMHHYCCNSCGKRYSLRQDVLSGSDKVPTR